jgi:FkbM family methyltransferase
VSGALGGNVFMTMISYAQNFEDVMLWRALGHVENGFYIDIGAQDPVVDSVSLAFYEKGWRGIHVEPSTHCAVMLRQARPDDMVIQAAASSGPGVLSFFDVEGGGLSTCDAQIAKKYTLDGLNVQERIVPSITLDDVFARKQGQWEDIHWLKIDVEGAEKQVLMGWRKSKARPWVVVIESTLPMTQVLSHQKWEKLILRKGYKFAYFDGLNRFYLSLEHLDLISAFATGPNVFDDFALSGVAWSSWCKVLNDKLHSIEARALADRLDFENRQKHSELEVAREISLLKDASEQIARAHETEIQARNAQLLIAQERAFDAARTLAATEHTLGLQLTTSLLNLTKSANELANREREVADKFEAQAREHHLELIAFRTEIGKRDALLFAIKEEFNSALTAARDDALRSAQALALKEREIGIRLVASAKAEFSALVHSEKQFLESVEKSHSETQQVLRTEIKRMSERELELCNQLNKRIEENSALQRSAQAERHETHLLVASLREDSNQSNSEHQQRERSLFLEITETKEAFSKLQNAQIQIKEDFASSLAKHHKVNVDLRQLLLEVRQEQTDLVNTLSWRLTKPFRKMSERFFGNRGSKNERITRRDTFVEGALTSDPAGNTPSNLRKVPMSPAMNSNNVSPLDRAAISISEMLSLEGETFIDCAYFTILKRAPDPPGGTFYLSRLLAGEKKIQILDEISASEEAELAGVLLPGLRISKANPASSLTSLVELDGEQFIDCSYLTLLRRLPDASGKRTYYDLLLNGVGKIDILNEISSSEEGRRAGVNLSGLTAAVERERRARQPFVEFVNRVFGRYGSPKTSETRLRAVEQRVIRLSHQSEANYASLLREFASISRGPSMPHSIEIDKQLYTHVTSERQSEPTDAHSILLPQTQFAPASANAVIAQLAKNLIGSAEAQKLSA